MTDGGYLTRNQIMVADDIHAIDVSVPEWGGVLRVRMMTGGEREQYETLLSDTQKKGPVTNIRASLVAWCAVDGNGQRLFSIEDVAVLGTKSAVALNRVFDAARKLNAMTTDEVNDIKKNSGPTGGDVSVSD